MNDKARNEALCFRREIERIKALSNWENMIVPVFVHASVDGDCIGSAGATVLLLRSQGINSVVAVPEKLPDTMDFLNIGEIVETNVTKLDELAASDLIPLTIAVDCSASSRMGIMGRIYDSCEQHLIVDHHQSVKLEGEGVWVDPAASSASELVYLVIREYAEIIGIEPASLISEEMAELLLTGIVTDTGRFTYTNTQPCTLMSAGELMTYGGRITPICYNLFDRQTEGVTRLIGYTLCNSSVYCEGKLAIAVIKEADFERFGADDASIGAVVTELRDIDTVEVAFVLRETADNKIRVNIRSKSYFDCSSFAEGYGGGGHIRAAGMSFDRSVKECPTVDDLASEIVEKASSLL